MSASTVDQQTKADPKFESKVAAAKFVGKLIGERALDKGIKKVVFDRNGFLYHGRVKSLSEGAREAGLVF
jgi:large subunit ribosomal protein L18